MKKGVFITSPSICSVSHTYPWQKAGALIEDRETELPREKGLLTFRRFFEAKKTVKRAVLRATALGIFDVYINGERIGEEELKPGWTDYRVRAFEFEYDVSALVGKKNVFTAMVSNGWWSGRISYGFYGYKSPALCAEIELEYEDGDGEIIASDESFDSCIQGPVMFADIWDGEYYDATEKFDVSNAGFEPSVRFEETTCKIAPHIGEPVRVRKHLERTPLSSTLYNGTEADGSDFGKIRVLSRKSGEECFPCKIENGARIILDMGQNMVGRPCVHLRAARGTKISIYFAEMLNDSGEIARGCDGAKGTLYMKNYRSALSRAVYVASGEGDEVYSPRFTFFGFRYIELKVDGEAEILSVVGEVLGTDMAENGRIETDNDEVNRLISNITWGARGNYLSVPTDCPQRDERLGWTGDTQIFCGAGAYLMNVNGFMRKWLCDMRDAQVGFNGVYCEVIPRIWHRRACGHSAWTDASIIVAYRMYRMYGDTELLREHYDSMEEYMAAIERDRGADGALAVYGDWLAYDPTDKEYISLCYHAQNARMMAEISRALGKEDRAAHYEHLLARIKVLFCERYVEDGDLTERSQTAYLLALGFDVADRSLHPALTEKLKNKIIENDYTLSTGFVGTGVISMVLSQLGLDGLAYSLLLQAKDPSWLFSVREGATTIWERWNSYTQKRGFGDVKMNSFNHYAYGAVAEWMFAYMAGIQPGEAGFERFVLCPRPDMRSESELPEGQKRISRVSAEYTCSYGTIRSEWERKGEDIAYKFEVPSGASACVEIFAPVGRKYIEINGEKRGADTILETKEGEKWGFELPEGKYIIK